MSDKYDSSNEFSLDRIYRKRHLKTCYFNDMTPDDLIKNVTELKESVKEFGYENVKISVDTYDYGDGVSTGVEAYGYSMETDDEYKTRLKNHFQIVKKNKKTWEERTEYFTGTGKGTWQDLVDRYTIAINKLN